MNKENNIIIAFVFNRAGKKEMSFSEFYLTLSMDLNWFKPDEAKRFTKNSLQNNLLKEEEELIKPNFNIDEVKIPLGFHPSEKVLQQKDVKGEKKQDKNILDDIIKKIVEKSNLDKKIILQQIEALEKEKNITTELAVLLIGKEYDLVFDNVLDEIEESIIKN